MKNLVPKLGLFLLILIFTLGQLGGCSCATDTVSPVVQISNPVNNSDVSGIVIIQAKASDDVGVAKVEFYIDNSKVGEDSQSLYKCWWDTSKLDYGSTHTIQAKAYDNAGNVGESSIITVVIGDSQLPTVTITNPTDGSKVTGTVTIKANAVDRSISKGKSKAPSGIQKVEFYVDDRLLGEDLTSPYEYSWNTDSLAYGSSHTIQAKAYDNAGNVGESSIITVVIGDSQLPTVTITNPVDGGTVTGTVTIKAEAVDRSIPKGKTKAPSGIQKVEFYVDDIKLGEDLTTPYEYSWNTDSLAYGSTHTIYAKAYDKAGKTEVSPSITVTIGDDQLPNVTITSPANGETVRGTVTIKAEAVDRSISKGKSKAPSGIQKVEFYVDDRLLGEDLTAPYEYSWNTDTLAYGSSHTIQAKAYDNAGNVGESSIITVVIGDSQLPTVTIINPVDGGTVTGTVTIKAEAVDRSISKGKSKAPSGIQKVEFYIDEQLKYTDSNSPYTYNWNTDSLQYGSTHIVTVIAYDFSGNTGRDSVAIIIGNGEAPMVTITSPANGSKVTGTVIIKAETVERSIPKGKTKAPSGIQKVEFYVNDIKLGEDLTAPYEYSWNTDSLAYGSSHTIYVKAYDNAGNEGVSFPITVTKGDDLAPNVTVTIINPVDGNTVVGPVTGTVIIRANAVDRSIPKGKTKTPSGIKKVEFYVDDRLLGETSTSPYDKNWNTDNLAYGSTHTIYVKAYDNAGNEGVSPSLTVTIGDSQLPTVTITSPVDGGTVIGIVTIKANAVDRSISKGKSKAPSGIQKVEFYVDGDMKWSDSAAPYEYSWNTDTLAYGSTHTIYAKAYDNAGNEGVSPSLTVTIGDDLAPTVTITNPVDGETVRGTVTIKADAIDRSIPKGKTKAPSGIQKVEFYVDGDMKWSDSAAPYEYSWNTDSLAYGSTHTVYAKAYDNTEKTGVSPSITVTIGDDLDPNVTITSPANGETVTELVTVIVTAEERASSKKKAISGIKKVELYINGDKVGESPSVPYEYKWDTVTCENGKYTLIARVRDIAGNEGESAPVSVIVNNLETYRFLAGWGSLGSVDGRFNKPRGIAVDLSGHVYVADYNNHRIQKFDSNGNLITTWGSYGSDEGEFQYPFGIAIDSYGYVYVADTKNHRIQKFDSNGNFITKWGSYGIVNGAFDHPFGIAVDTLGNVYVADTENNRIQKFDSNGIFITTWGSRGSDEGQFMFPYGIAVDTLGNVYVTDTENNRIQKFTPNGTFVTKWGLWGSEPSHFKWPYGIAIKSIEDYVYVADTENDRIQKFECIRRIRRK